MLRHAVRIGKWALLALVSLSAVAAFADEIILRQPGQSPRPVPVYVVPIGQPGAPIAALERVVTVSGGRAVLSAYSDGQPTRRSNSCRYAGQRAYSEFSAYAGRCCG